MIPPHVGSSQAEGADAQAASGSPLAVSTYSQGVSAACHRQVVHRQSSQVAHRQLTMALTPREIAPFPLKQVVPGQKALMPRQSTLPAKQSALPPWV